jgi:microcystin-dependent protein
MMSSAAISKTGDGKGHENMSPYLALNFAIATTGVLGTRDGMLGEIIMFAGKYISNENVWAFCDGNLLSIAQNTALFSLLAATYGGTGYSTFALPDLKGRAPMRFGKGAGLSERELGKAGGSATVTLTEDQLPEHKHEAVATTAAALTSNPYNSIWATGGQTRGGVPFYTGGGIHTAMNPEALVKAGGGKPHNNLPPYLGINFLICLQGEYPSRPTS